MLNFDKPQKTDESFKVEHNVNKEFTYNKSVRRIPGLKLWAFNPKKPFNSKDIIEVDVQRKEVLDISEKQHPVIEPELKRSLTENKVSQHPELVYFQALNRKNAIKHALRYLKKNKYQ